MYIAPPERCMCMHMGIGLTVTACLSRGHKLGNGD